jgi:hypothetical protein
MKFASFLALICVTHFASYAGAAILVDQTHVGPETAIPGGMVPGEGRALGQVVTAGISGRLSRIDLGLWRNGEDLKPLYVDITTVSDTPGFEVADRLATRVVEWASVPSNIRLPHFDFGVDFSADDLRFNAGDRFAIVLRSEESTFPMPRYIWSNRTNAQGTYPGGRLFVKSESGVYEAFGDAYFRTYVEAVPEPPAIAIVATSLIGLAATRRRFLGVSSL